jgi:putative transposase
VEEMSQSISPVTACAYGLKRVCKAWDISRSTYYAKQKRLVEKKAEPLCKRGPKPLINDEKILEAIKQDISSSPFKGEGHRKVHARIKRKKIKVSRTSFAYYENKQSTISSSGYSIAQGST